MVSQKRKPINRLEIFHNVRKGLHFYKILIKYLFYWHITRYIECMNKHWPFQMVLSKIICAEWEFLTGSATMSQIDVVEPDIHWYFLSTFVMFLLLNSLFVHGLASLTLVSINTIICANTLTCIVVNCSLSHARYHYLFWYQMKEEKMLLIMKHTVSFNLAWQWRYSLITRVSLLPWTHCINMRVSLNRLEISLHMYYIFVILIKIPFYIAQVLKNSCFLPRCFHQCHNW